MEETAGSSPQRRFVIQEAQTRFLYPFLVKSNQTGQAAKTLACLVHRGHQVWECAAPPDLYKADLLENVSGFLFPENGPGCCFLKVQDRLLNSWFRSGIRMQTAKGKTIASAVSCSAIELFLSPYGAGVLSLTLKPSLTMRDEKSFDQDYVKEFNYRGSQLPRDSKMRSGNVPVFSIPHPSEDKARAEKLKAETPPAPSPDANISERLGAAGGAFNLSQLRDFLIGPLRMPEPKPEIQNQFSVYTVVRFGKETNFEMDDLRHEMGPFLAGLAQIEEVHHAGAPCGQIRIVNSVLNAKHWVAVSSLGAAHLIADQGIWEPSGPSLPFDAQRLQIVLDRYFMPYLLAYLQRLTTIRVIRDAQRMVNSLGEGSAGHRDTGLSELRLEMLRFMVCSNFPEISHREALNCFYDLARQGLRVPESLEIAKGAIADLDAATEAKRGNQNIEIVADVQTKVEWLEIFFVSFYAAELSHIVAELWNFDHIYMAVTVPLCAIVALFVTAFFLRPWNRKTLSLRAPILVSLFVIVWFVAGLLWPKPPTEAAPSTSHSELTSDHPGAEVRLP